MEELKKTINVPYGTEGGNALDTITGANSTFFTGVDDLINLNFDPYVSGYAFIYWVQLPSWFEKDPDLKYFKNMTQKNFRSFQGVTSIELTTLQQQTGFAGREYDVAGGITTGNTEFTISHKEYSGGVMRKMYQKWVSYIRDPRSGVAIYPKLFGIEYGARNHTGELIYIVTRADATNTSKNIIEYAAFYSNVMPKNIPLDILYNYEQGQQDSPTIDINFSGFCEIGPDVEEYAKSILAEKVLMNEDNDAGINFKNSFGDISSLFKK